MIVLCVFLSLYSIDSILARPELNSAQVGVYVLNLSNDSVVYARNSQKILIPASNMKIVTTGACLTLLGPTYRFKTRLAIRGELKKNELNGDIIIVGGGDPSFSLENLEQFVLAVKSNKIDEIKGNIILDDSYFTEISLLGNSFIFERLPRGWAWHYLDARYAPEISALSMNKNCVSVRMEATELDDYADVKIEPETGYVKLVSDMITKEGEDSIIILRSPEVNTIYVSGGIGLGHKKNIEVAIKDPALFLGHYYKERLLDEDVRFSGKILKERGTSFSVRDTVQNEMTIDSVISPPLIDLLKELNVESVNLYAEVFIKTLGARYYSEGSFNAGRRALKRFIALCGADTSRISVSDGSGLSRRNLISPYYLALILRYMYLSRFAATFFDLMPTSGEGTLERRFNDLGEIMRAKTGTLFAVSCLSGYLRVNNADYCFSMMFNNFTCKRKKIEEMQEEIIKILAKYLRAND
jgi:D-alanyl-D-alanine carboxypeptidase/D-alanyl-D-alanine-endopeptidase (penicillin-binding protein 4)